MKAIVGPLLLDVSSLEVDCEQAADLTVLENETRKIACRVRSYGYADRYPDQFTIRAMRDSGAKTEFHKMFFDGWADWMLYGHQSAPESVLLDPWWILALRIWRTTLKHDSHNCRNGGQSQISLDQISNGDGTYFYAFHIFDFPTSMVVAQSAAPRRQSIELEASRAMF